MADQNQEPIVIVDVNGDEHEFPPGTDPKFAAATVRKSLEAERQKNMAAQHETDNPTEAVLNSVRDTASRAIQGVKNGVTSALNPVNTIRMIPHLVDALTDPAKVMQQGYEMAPGVIEEAKKVLAGDTEAGNRSIEAGGEALGQLALGKAIPKVLPMVQPALTAAGEAIQDNPALSATARGAGRFMVGAAKHSSFPVRIAGAHQVLSGNVGPGMAMVMAPEIAEGVGNKLISLGTAPGAALTTPVGQILRMKMDLEQAASGDATALKNVQDRIAKTQSDLADRLAVARNDAEVAAVKSMQDSLSVLARSARRIAGARTAAELNRARLDLVRERLAGMKEGAPSGSVTTSAKNDMGGTERVTVRSTTPEAGSATDSAVDDLVKSGFARDRAQAQEILSGRGGAVASHAAPIRPVPSHMSSLVQEPGAVGQEAARIAEDILSGNRGPIRPMAGYTSPEPGSPMTPEHWREFAESLPPNPDLAIAHAEDAMDRPMSIADRAARNADIDQMEAAIDAGKPVSSHATTSRPAQQPVSGVRPSATSREMSATPGLSVNDVKSIGLNPNMKITKLTPEMANKILKDRALRATDYREMAALKKRLEQLIANSNQ